VDINGNSIAGQSEAVLESDYYLIDVGLFGTSRSKPIYLNVSSQYAGSIINSDDAEVGPGIDQALYNSGVNWAELPAGATVTVTFSDGTKAQFYKSGNMSYHWIWNGVAFDKNGSKINRQGQLTKPNTSGTGAGLANVDGVGGKSGGSNYTFGLTTVPNCEVVITVGDGGITFGDFHYVVPC
jgi:hypothetical protein